MRRIVYSVAMSLDGYIAGPGGDYDWIVIDPDIGFEEFYSRFDTLIMGRRTFEAVGGKGGGMKGITSYVFSRTLRPADHPKVNLVTGDAGELRGGRGKDVWLFGGGELFRSLHDARLVDAVEVAVVPVLLGGGVPLLPPPAPRAKLKLVNSRAYAKTGTVSLEYAVDYAPEKPKPKARRATGKA